MSKEQELKWGETPWDNMTKEELLREVQRMYSAVSSTGSCLRVLRASAPEAHPFWFGEGGTGFRAIKKADQIEAKIAEAYSSEDVYRSFFRYADDLLFEGIGSDWAVCPKCGTMIGGGAGRKCSEFLQQKCNGILRPLTWDDLKPEQ